MTVSRLARIGPVVAVMDQSLFDLPCVQGLVQCIQHQLCVHRPTHSPTHDPSSENVDDESDVHKACPRGNECKIGHPQLIRSRGYKTSLHSIQWLLEQVIGHRRARSATAHDAPEACLASIAPRYSGPRACILAAAASRPCVLRRLGSSPPIFAESIHAARHHVAGAWECASDRSSVPCVRSK